MGAIEWSRFAQYIEALIKYQARNTRAPITADSWEELTWAALAHMYGRGNVIWRPRSHEPSIDIRVWVRGREYKLALKAGVIKNGRLTLSSYRLTRFGKDLAEKLRFIGQEHSKKIDYYLICAREEYVTHITYRVYVVKPESLAPPQMLNPQNWEDDGKKWYLKRRINGIYACIVKSMSDQLWYDIDLDEADFLKELVTVEIPKDQLGMGLIEFLREKFPQSA